VKFTQTNDGTDLYVAMTNGQIYVSGRQQLQPRHRPQTNVNAAAIYLGGGEWGYYLPAMPSVYAAPLNDTPSFSGIDGELTGQALFDGTYTIGLQLVANYEFDNTSYRDAGAATHNFLYGGATTVTPRAVVADANCNVCHTTVRAHGGSRVDVDLCLLCHTSGAEDRNNAAFAGGTPGASVDFRVMIHKIHNGKHLPSVNGLTTDVAGARVYGASIPLQYVGFNNSVIDLSEAAFPVFPAFNIQMPRDAGYAALSSTNQGKENLVRTGVVSCDKCHGDPDGTGPETAPAQGNLWKTQPARHTCGSCHDDVDWAKPYTANLQTMGANKGNETCALSGCHDATGTPLSVEDAHRHPILNPAQAPEIAVNVSEVKEAGVNNADNTVDPGEKIQVKFRIQYTNGPNAGLDVPLSAFTSPVSPATAGSFTMIIAGPTSNYNLLVNSGVPMNATLANAHPAWSTPVGGVYTMLVPEQIVLEKVGVGTNGLDIFPLSRGGLSTALTTLYRRGAPGVAVSTTTTVAAE
jgi:OmcA/MtrC family decaheme c-type cytochrome